MSKILDKGKTTTIGAVSIRKQNRKEYVHYHPERKAKQIEQSLDVTNLHAMRVKAAKIGDLIERGQWEEVNEADTGQQVLFVL